MSKIIAVIGATGAQGGSVATEFLKLDGWKVRAITRNASSDKAKALQSQGAEVVTADCWDEASLVKAFEGATAIFAVTSFFEVLFRVAKGSPDEAAIKEAELAKIIARAAAKTSSLEHYIWSTLPSAKAKSGGKFPVPHFDGKAEADEWIKSNLPDLHKKTTYLMVGFYPNNIASIPGLKPVEFPGSRKWIQMLPTPASTMIAVSGDIRVTPGVWVRQIIAKPELTKGKYTSIGPETLSYGKMLEIYGEVTDRQTAFIQISVEDCVKLWGIAGKELADQLAFNECCPRAWESPDYASKEELGIKDDEWPDLKQTLESLKDQL